jgi:hypothetical protein
MGPRPPKISPTKPVGYTLGFLTTPPEEAADRPCRSSYSSVSGNERLIGTRAALIQRSSVRRRA